MYTSIVHDENFNCILIETSSAAPIQFQNISGVTAMTGGSTSGNILVIPEDVPGMPSINAIIRAKSDAMGLPEMPTRIHIGAEIGLPATPEQNGQLMFEKTSTTKDTNQVVSWDHCEILHEWNLT